VLIRARSARPATPPEVARDPDVVEAYLEDASGAPPGHAVGLSRPVDEAELAALVRATSADGTPVLCQAARTSLTTGAVPRGELVVSVERMSQIGAVERTSNTAATVRVQPGVRLDALREALAERGWYYPPVPTYEQAMVGGTVATNAGGAATFKYGVTRQWVRGLTVVLSNGDVLDVERGQAVAPRGGKFRIGLANGEEWTVPVPTHTLPDLKKISAGYFSADPLDLVDLFVGSEGTLGVICSATLDLIPLPPAVVTGLVFLQGSDSALGLAARLRSAAIRARLEGDPRGPDVRAIESIDANGLELLRTGGQARRLRIGLPGDARAALLFELELAEPTDNETAYRLASQVLEGRAPSGETALERLFGILRDHDVLDTLEIAFPEDVERARALKEFREAVPRGVGELLRGRRRDCPQIKKVAGDLIVPFEHVGEMIRFYEERYRARRLDYAIWGHLSDGNLHPNALPRDPDQVRAGAECVLEFAQRARTLGGCPLSEHGVGRDPLKQEILRRFLGQEAVERMRQVKRALDPQWRLAPGVLFPSEAPRRSAP
jgi:D-lactate dehydrogenase (cytochrome)